MSHSQHYSSADGLEVRVDVSEMQPLLIPAPHPHPHPHPHPTRSCIPGTSQFYPSSNNNDSNSHISYYARNATPLNEKRVNPCSEDGKLNINPTWNNFQIRSTALSNEPGPRKIVVVGFTTMLLSLAAIWSLAAGHGLLCQAFSPNAREVARFAPPEIQNSWGPYTPYYSVKEYAPPPSNCRVSQVNIIQRHGARFPTSGATTRILVAVNKLKSATSYTDPRLDFLTNYTYSLGVNDQVAFGAFQSAEAGGVTFMRYAQLISQDHLPFVRASSGQRVVDAATNWTTGFSLASNHVYNPVLSVILSESGNDTLDDNMCPAAGSSDAQTDTWTTIYGTSIAARLNAQAPGAGLVAADISNLIPLCAFESVAKGVTSPFCALFTAAEFAQYEYYADLDKFYGTGYGQPLGPVQGVGYINELLARLTGTAVSDNTQTNRTLDADPVTFPLDRTIYADFSHDNQMVAIYAAMGLFKQPGPLDPTNPDPNRTWIMSQLTPFSGRMVTERLVCTTRNSRHGMATGVYVRILVNDALQPLDFCGGDNYGLCKLSDFVNSQVYARNDGEGDFEKCFA